MTVLVTTMYLKGGSEKEWLCYLCNHVKEASALLASSSKVNEEKNVRMCHYQAKHYATDNYPTTYQPRCC